MIYGKIFTGVKSRNAKVVKLLVGLAAGSWRAGLVLTVGWMLRRTYWGHGFATEGAKAAMNYAFREFQQSLVISLISPENPASMRVVQELGEKPEGTTEILAGEVVI